MGREHSQWKPLMALACVPSGLFLVVFLRFLVAGHRDEAWWSVSAHVKSVLTRIGGLLGDYSVGQLALRRHLQSDS
jgi:hypothetical protein